MYAKIETERLNFMKESQSKFRAKIYFDLHDAFRSDPTDMGQKAI